MHLVKVSLISAEVNINMPFYVCYCLLGAKGTWPLFTEWFKMTMNDSSDISFIVVAN